MTKRADLELWAGIECTQNRVGNAYFEQLDRTGHAYRSEDLDLIAELGAKAIRYPVLWERIMPTRHGAPEWQWSDERLAKIQQLGIRPIIGLLHHGSGPEYTSLIDPEFPEKFAEYASQVARRYPWVLAYTPVNEPLTTARFSGLYGHWYPHGRNDQTFVRALLNQCRATVLAMQVIRSVNPSAQLIQTEDLGFTASSPLLQYQADFENERRWLSLDLLCGTVTPSHPLWEYLLGSGASEAELRFFSDHPCPPDVVGFNYYLTSQRLLHEKLALFPLQMHGGNHRHRYADIELARVRAGGMIPLHELLLDAWERFELPLAITECHNGCTREEQLRWLHQVWQSARNARNQGADIRAVTAWSVFGAWDWNSLVTQSNGFYEPGLFDIRAVKPRPTALAGAWQESAQAELRHPLVTIPGWWEREDRLAHGFAVEPFGAITQVQAPPSINVRYPDVAPVLITGARGTLGRQIALHCEVRAIPYRLLSRDDMDIADPVSVASAMDLHRPWAVINAAGYVRVDEAEQDPRCWRENCQGPQALAQACAERGVRFVTFSSDLVFDGAKSEPYVESDNIAPLNEYGRSKAEAERAVASILPSALVIRTSAFFSPLDEYNFVTIALRELAAQRPFHALTDYTVSPTYVPDLVRNTLDLLLDNDCGIWHLANTGEVTWYDLAQRAADAAGVSTRSLRGVTLAEAGLRAQRPRYSALRSERGWIMPALESALVRYVADCDLLLDRMAA